MFFTKQLNKESMLPINKDVKALFRWQIFDTFWFKHLPMAFKPIVMLSEKNIN